MSDIDVSIFLEKIDLIRSALDSLQREVEKSLTIPREEVLLAQDIRVLRKNIARVENRESIEYEGLDKYNLVRYILKFEDIIGRTIEEEWLVVSSKSEEDTDDIQDESKEDNDEEDDNSIGELTKEQAFKLDIDDLVEYAKTKGIHDDLNGLDVPAVIKILFPINNEESTEVTEEITEEQLNRMSIGQLKKLIDDLNAENGWNIKYSRSSLRGELIDAIFEAAE